MASQLRHSPHCPRDIPQSPPVALATSRWPGPPYPRIVREWAESRWGRTVGAALASQLAMETAHHVGDVAAKTGRVTSIDLCSLAPGTEVVVLTRNSHYRFVMLDHRGRKVLARGGDYFPQETIARIEGSTVGGSALRPGRIDLGSPLELSFEGDRIVTSPVQALRVDCSSALT